MSASSNTKLVIFRIGGNEEQIVMTRTGITAESLLKVLQLLRDHSSDTQVKNGARFMIFLISQTLRSSIRNVGVAKVTVSFKWLRELSQKVSSLANEKTQQSAWFVIAFVNEIVPIEKTEELTQ